MAQGGTGVRSDMEFWRDVRRQVLTGELSQRAAMKQYGLGWHTLKKILTHDEPPGYRLTRPRKKRKLEPFLPIIHQILEDDRQAPKKQRHTAHRVFERLRDEHGYTGGETVVKDAVRAWKQTRQEVFLPLSHPPGEAQVDFGEATIRLAGQETKVALFVMTLPYWLTSQRTISGLAPQKRKEAPATKRGREPHDSSREPNCPPPQIALARSSHAHLGRTSHHCRYVYWSGMQSYGNCRTQPESKC